MPQIEYLMEFGHDNKNTACDSSSGYAFKKYLKARQIFYLYLSPIPIILHYLYATISVRLKKSEFITTLDSKHFR